MKKLIFIFVMILLSYSVFAVDSLNCIQDSTPFMSNDIEWLCYINTIDIKGCISYVDYNDQVIQVNPKRIEVKDYGIIETFESQNGLFNVKFNKRDLRDNNTVTFGVRCGDLVYEKNITPNYKDPYEMIDRGSWIFQNRPYFMYGFVIIVSILILIKFIKWYLESR